MTTISEKIVRELPTPGLDKKGKQISNKVHFFSGAKLQAKTAPSGFGVRVTAAGSKTFVLFQRADGRKFLHTVGLWEGCGGKLSVLLAIMKAKELVDELGDKKADPRPKRTQKVHMVSRPADKTVSWLLDNYVADHRAKPEQEKLRSLDQIAATFEKRVKPAIGAIGIYALRRSNITDMLSTIAKERGPVMSDQVLAYLRSAFNWYAPNDDEFSSPIVARMAKTKPALRRRERILDDQEIRDLWAALDAIADAPACYPAYIKALFLTATRRTETADMHSTELDGDVWTIPAARYKTKRDHVVPLSAAALEIIAGMPGKGARFIFSTTAGEKAFSGYSKAKIELDKAIAKIRAAGGREPAKRWTLHDLRRTARSLMSRAGVNTDHAERAIGHVIGGVRGTYDRHQYLDEKRDAFERLAALVNTIVNPPAGNVVSIRKGAAQ